MQDCKGVADFADGGDDRVVCDNLAGQTNDKSEAGRVELLRGVAEPARPMPKPKQKSTREGVPGGKKVRGASEVETPVGGRSFDQFLRRWPDTPPAPPASRLSAQEQGQLGRC